MPKLNQVLAIEKGVANRYREELTALHRANGVPKLFEGFSKEYRPKDEDGEKYPPESQPIPKYVWNEFSDLREIFVEFVNIAATRDVGNCNAKADLVVDGEVVVADLPATHLLFLEKELQHILTYCQNLPVLADTEKWQWDKSGDCYKTAPVDTHKTKKVEKPLVLIEPTEHHPGQAKSVIEDEIVGWWTTTKMSGAVPRTKKRALVKRAEELLKAAKSAREEANSTQVERKEVGDKIFDYLMKDVDLTE